MRMGLIGCGTVGAGGHLPALSALPEVELVALSDVRASRLSELGARYGVERLYTDYRELLSQPDIDAVTVATPVHSHYPVVMDALAAGKHVLCEKPLADAAPLGWEMVQAAEKAGRLLAVNFEMRAGHVYRSIKESLAAGEIGRVRFMRLIYNWAGGRWAGIERHRMLMTEGKGPIFDCGVHFFDLVRWYSESEFNKVEARGIFVEDYPYPDHAVATCLMENGVLAVVDESWVFGHTAAGEGRYYIHRIDIEGEDGTITAAHADGGVELKIQSSRGVRTTLSREGKAFAEMYRLFVESVQAGRLIDLASGVDGVRAVEAAEAALSAVLAADFPR